MIVIGPLGLLLLACLAFRPLRRLALFLALILAVLAVGAFGHVQFIRDAPIVALPIALTPFVLGWMARRL